jgi:nucleoside-diphosphate-sugar epimerase
LTHTSLPPGVAVTGASGFIGRHLCARLRAAGHPVRALVRRPTGGWGDAIDERVVPDLADRDALARAAAGCDVLIHLAGRAHVLRETAADPAAAFHHANVDGTASALDAARAVGARQFVLLSSIAAVGAADAGCVDDATPAQPASSYGASKLAAEELVRGRAGGMCATIFRPPMVYGPGMKGNPLRLFRLLDRGLPLPLGAVRNRRSLLYVGNLVDAVVAALAAPARRARRARRARSASPTARRCPRPTSCAAWPGPSAAPPGSSRCRRPRCVPWPGRAIGSRGCCPCPSRAPPSTASSGRSCSMTGRSGPRRDGRRATP